MATLEELEAAPVGNCMKNSKLVRDFKIHDSFAFPLVSAIFFKDSEPCWGDNTFQAHKHSFSQFFSQTMLIFPGRIKGQNDWLHCWPTTSPKLFTWWIKCTSEHPGPGEGVPACARGWSEMSLDIPSITNRSMIL